jgi:putative membrane protein insertion efficiency factor
MSKKKMKKLVMKLLVFYKKYISRGYNCRFTPSCSEYSYQAVEKYGVIKGLWLALKRVIKCNPWSKGGMDLLE